MRVLVSLLMLMALATAEKLGDIEVITREELVDALLTPPERTNVRSNQDPQARIVVTGPPAPLSTLPPSPPPSPPPPAISYLPPSQTPLPIEQRPVTVDPPIIIIETDYLPPQPQPIVHKPVTESPPVIETDYLPPQPQPIVPLPAKPEETYGPPSIGSEVEQKPVTTGVAVGGSYGSYGGSYDDDHYSGGVSGGIHYEQTGGKGDFFQGIKDSKSHLFGGIVGSKVAFVQGIKNAKEALFTGIKDSITAKKEAFDNLRGSKFSAGVHVHPIRPRPQPVYPPQVYPLPTYPDTETAYPKPTYPQPTYPQPTYPQPTYPLYPPYPRPVYPQRKRNPFAAHWAAKKAKFDTWKQDIKNKWSGLFQKGQSHHHTYPSYGGHGYYRRY